MGAGVPISPQFALNPERQPYHVLLVDDEMLIRTTVAEALRDAGLTVIEGTVARLGIMPR
jgi:AmiR/NasT family two-component response regulator